ncbi:integrase, catalytic region, zinc finger, CCHC-type containing protein [Tanacetum coccineum]
MVEEVTSLKKDFKQKENKYLEEFLDMKALKGKVKDKLYKQDQSLQKVHLLCKLKPYYNEQNKVAIGYKNPLCLTRAKQVQPALYNGHEIIKPNQVPDIMHNSEDTLEIAEITRKKMNDKMKDPECVKKKTKIAPHDYSKENYLATFTPHKQLTPEQIFWSKDLIKMKTEALKEQITSSRPIKALTMYPPNTPATLALTKEMKEIFEELEAEVDQNVMNRKHDEIERKNLLIANDNLISDCLSKEVFYIATNSKLTVSRFTEMHVAHTVIQARCLELKSELSKLLDKFQKDDHTELTRSESDRTLDFRALDFQITQLTEKVNVLQEQNELFRTENVKIKQHYKELYDYIKITRAKHIDQTTALLTENENLKVQIHENLKCITMDSVKPRVLATGRYAIDVEPIPPRNRNNREVHLENLKHLKESVETLREIVEEAKVKRPLDSSLEFACLYTIYSQELLEYAIGTCPKDFIPRDKKHAATALTRKKQVTFEDQCETSNSNTHKHVEQLNIQKTNVLVTPSTGVNSCTDASGLQPRSNTKKNRIFPAKSVNKKKVKEHSRTNKSSLKTTSHIDSSIISWRTVINLNSHSVCKTCNKCLISINHDMCVVNYLHSVNASPYVKNMMHKVKKVWKPKQVKQVWKATGKVLTNVGYQWRPTGRIFTLGEQCPLTRLTKLKVVPATHTENVSTSKSVITKKLSRTDRPLVFELRLLKNNDGLGSAHGSGISVYYVEGLGHNLFSDGQFCDSNLEVAFRKHSYLCGPMREQTINGKKYILVIVDDYLRFTWLKFLRSKDETLEVIIKFLKQIQIDLNKTVRYIRTDNGTEFVNQVLTEYYECVGIFHQKSVPRTPQQNGLSKVTNRTLAEAIATACYTQNRSLIHTRHNKTPYELVHDKKPDLTFFRVFGALCYPTYDSKDLGKL